MSDTKLPALSGLDKAGLQAAYQAELGKAPGDLDMTELREAIKGHRESVVKPDAANAPAAPSPLTVVAPAADAPAKALPGSPDFDVDNATDEEFAKHETILRRRAIVAGLTTTAPDAHTAVEGYTPTSTAPATPGPVVAGPGELIAVHPERGERVFSEETWDGMKDTKGNRDGWEVKVPEPAKD